MLTITTILATEELAASGSPSLVSFFGSQLLFDLSATCLCTLTMLSLGTSPVGQPFILRIKGCFLTSKLTC